MMNHKYIFLILCCVVALFSACEDDAGRKVFPYSCPQMSALNFSFTNEVTAADSLYFSVDIMDPETPLSTLEVELTSGDTEIFKTSIRTAGYEAKIKDYGIYVPFSAGTEESTAKLTLTAINVEGSELQEVKTFTIKRPEIPQTIYLHLDDEVIAMKQSEDNPYEYISEDGNYPNTFSGKISTHPSLDESTLIWGASESNNLAELGTPTGAAFAFNFPDWQIDNVTFNTFTFKLGVVGFQKDMRINGVLLDAIDGYYQAIIQFEQGAEVTISGFEDPEGAYNRDFFDYDAQTGKLTFLRESGYWEVYYSTANNYMWVARMDDTAPDAFWLVGHGFISSPVWNNDYNFGGWSTDDIARMAYVVKIAENTYQTTIYLSDTHEWGPFEVEIYSDREWGKNLGMELQESSFSGDTVGFAVSNSNGFTNVAAFVPGYYRLTFDTSGGVSNEKMHIERIGN